MDLLWLLTRAEYSVFEKPMPSSIEYGTGPADTRTGKQIQQALLKRLKESE